MFDPTCHVLLGVGQAPNRGLQVGQTVKLTAMVDRPELNGRIGRIQKVDGEEARVAKVDLKLKYGCQMVSDGFIVRIFFCFLLPCLAGMMTY